MADETMDIGKISLEKLTKEARDYIESLKAVGIHTINIGDFTNKFGAQASAAFSSATTSLKGFFETFGHFTEEAKMAESAAKDLFVGVENIIKDSDLAIEDLVLTLEPMVEIINKNITGMGKLGDAGGEAGNKISTAFEAIAPSISKVFGNDTGVTKLFTAMAGGASKAINLRREIESIAIAQGNLSGVMNEGHTAFINMDKSYDQFATMSVNVAKNIRQTVGSVMDLEKALSDIPKSMHEAFITDVATIATTAHRSQLAVAKELSDMYTRLGTSEKDSLENMANIHEQAGDSKLRMESFAATVHNVAGNFKMLGDNTVAATTFVKAFDTAFQQSKISPEAMKDVIASIGDGIHRMDAGKKAFISGATGGPGGLAGSIQMDYAVQTGHLDEVIKKTMVAMQNQFGGQIVTLKDAAENPALAGEHIKQTQYLTQVAGIAKDEDQARRILEAMKSGVTDILKPGSEETQKGDVLGRHLEAGAGLQQQTNKTLMDIHITAEEARLRQDDIYHVLLASNPGVETILRKAAKAGNIDIDSIPSGENDSKRARNTGVSATLPAGSAIGETINNDITLNSMIRDDIGDMLKPVESVVKKFSNEKGSVNRLGEMLSGLAGGKPTDLEEARLRDSLTENKNIKTAQVDVHTQRLMSSPIPPPKMDHAPLIPRLELSQNQNQNKTGKSEFGLPSEMEHTFKPLEVHIDGEGIKQIIRLELEKTKREDLSRAAIGRP